MTNSIQGAVRLAQRIAGVALIAALGAFAGCGSSADSSSSTVAHPATWFEEADRICSQALFHREHMPPIRIATYDDVVPTMAQNERALARTLAGLDASKSEEQSIGRLVRLMVEQSRETDAAVATFGAHPFGANGRVPQHEAHVRRAQGLDGAIASVAQSLKANACAHTPVRTEYL
jgi:hypothetical protein